MVARRGYWGDIVTRVQRWLPGEGIGVTLWV